MLTTLNAETQYNAALETAKEASVAYLKTRKALSDAAWNLQFAKATPAEKRVMIAQDVLAQLELGTVKAVTGSYVVNVKRGDDGEIQGCNACALGSLFTCAARRGLSDAPDITEAGRRDMWSALDPYFDRAQLHTIENAFEAKKINDEGEAADPSAYSKKVIRYNKGIRSRKTRMQRVMKNIIRNDGTFIVRR